ncbi:MAG: hypothetical protein M1816_006615 [Peltula sp. TS41687]|nr:MAG: hypothetical protein M1816_006615 [Peltula sp. TS41687]
MLNSCRVEEVRPYQLPSPKHSTPPSASPPQTSLKRKADAITSQDAQPPPPKRLALTYGNLKGFQETPWSLPRALNEWGFVLKPKIAEQEMSRPLVPSSSQSPSQQFTDETPAGPLQKDPERYGQELDKDYGIRYYDYRNNSPKLPANLEVIRAALEVERNDTPTLEAFRRYCESVEERLVESDLGERCREFLGIFNDDGDHGNHKIPWTNFGTLLPPGQKSLTPDMSCGLKSNSTDISSWILAKIPGFVRGRSLISVNGIIEYKNSHKGSIFLARLQNRAAAGLAVHDWHRFSAIDPDHAPKIQHAYVGSICYDGNAIEASVHWIEPAPVRSGRQFNVHSHRIATGHPFAATYEEFQAVQKKFRNFVDWLKGIRTERLERIKAISEAGPGPNSGPDPGPGSGPNPGPGLGPVRRPTQTHQAVDDGDDGGNDEEEEETGNTQPMSHFSLDGANDDQRMMQGSAGSMPPPPPLLQSDGPPQGGGGGQRRRSRQAASSSTVASSQQSQNQGSGRAVAAGEEEVEEEEQPAAKRRA